MYMSTDSSSYLADPPVQSGYGGSSNRFEQAVQHTQDARTTQSDVANGRSSSDQTGGRKRRRQAGGSNGCTQYNSVSPTFSTTGVDVIPADSGQDVNSQLKSTTEQQNTACSLSQHTNQIGQPKGSVPSSVQQGGRRRRTRRRTGGQWWTSKPNDGPTVHKVNIPIGGSRKKRKNKRKNKRKKSKRRKKLCSRCRTCKCRY
jgi:hypothetical protein